MHKNLPGADKIRHLSLTQEEILTKQYSSEREIEDMSIFQNIKFIEFARRSETERRMLKLLGSYKSAHYKIQNSRHSEMHYNLMCAGIGAVLTTSLGIMQKPIDKDILFFIPKSEDSYRKIFLKIHTVTPPFVYLIIYYTMFFQENQADFLCGDI